MKDRDCERNQQGNAIPLALAKRDPELHEVPKHAALTKANTFPLEDRLRAAVDMEETRSAENIDVPPTEAEGLRPSKIYAPFSFPIIVVLMPSAVLGVLARLGLVSLLTFDGDSVFPLAYAQAVGCLVMGFALNLKDPLGQFYSPLYTAITTGFCGSLTTFSSWQMSVFNAWINAGQYHRGGFRDFLDGVGLTTITLALSLCSLAFGYNLAGIIKPHFPLLPFPRKITRYTFSVLSILTYGATFLTFFLLPKRFRHQATAALLFSFPGALTRYVLSILLNRRFKSLPAGTLVANTLGTALLAAFFALQRTHNPCSPASCSILQGLIDGYCGCLTTISTFAAEIRDLGSWKACRYALISWVLGQLVIVLIFGISIWTGHSSEQITCTFQ